MADIKIRGAHGHPISLRDMGDGTYAEVVAAEVGAVGGGGPSSDRELVVSTYRCKVAFFGASVGDTITATQVIDVSGSTPSTVATIWRNQSTSTDLAGAPNAPNLELSGSDALTNAQLRATEVPVSGVFWQATQPVSGPVTNAELRAAPVPTTENALIFTGAASQTAVVSNILEDPSSANGTLVQDYRSASVQVVSTGTGGTFIFEQSNDGTNWKPLPVFNAELVTGVPIVAAITATVSQIIYSFPIRCRYARLRIATAITGGNLRAHSRFSSEPWTPSVSTVAQPTAGNLNVTAALTGTNLAIVGQGAEDAAVAGNAVRVGGRVRNLATTGLVNGDASDLTITTGAALVVKPYAVPEVDWQYAGAAGGIAVTTAVSVKAAVAAQRNYVTGIDLHNASTTVTTEVTILDNTTVIWRTSLPPGARLNQVFPTPLRGSTNTAINVQCGTAGVVYANAQGFVAL